MTTYCWGLLKLRETKQSVDDLLDDIVKTAKERQMNLAKLRSDMHEETNAGAIQDLKKFAQIEEDAVRSLLAMKQTIGNGMYVFFLFFFKSFCQRASAAKSRHGTIGKKRCSDS
jgi:hypothetical protein